MYSYAKKYKLEEDIMRNTPTIQLDGTDEEYASDFISNTDITVYERIE